MCFDRRHHAPCDGLLTRNVRSTISESTLLIRNQLSAIDVLVLRGFRGVELDEMLVARRYVVPGAVLEIDNRLAVVVDRDDAPDDAGEALELRPILVDLHVLVDPFLAHIVLFFETVHGSSFVGYGFRAL